MSLVDGLILLVESFWLISAYIWLAIGHILGATSNAEPQ